MGGGGNFKNVQVVDSNRVVRPFLWLNLDYIVVVIFVCFKGELENVCFQGYGATTTRCTSWALFTIDVII